jgi:hypothetical protein
MLPPGARVFLATDRVDGRKGISGLSALLCRMQREVPCCTMATFPVIAWRTSAARTRIC